MDHRGRRAVVGIALIALAVVALGITWLVMPIRTPTEVAMDAPSEMDDAPQGRTPINVASLGPQVGDRVPDFSLPDQNGRVHTLDDILGPRGALLLFHRSADW